MLKKNLLNPQHILWCLTSLIYLIFFRNFIFNSGMTLPLLIFFAVFFIIILFLKEKFVINKTILGMILLPVIFIGLNELLLKAPLALPFSDDAMFFAQRYRKQFFYILLFLVLPTILFFIKFKTKHFFSIIYVSILISIGFNTYTNIHLGFDRNLLAQAFSPVILYDYGLIALSLLLICYGFYLKGKKSYLILALTITNIFLLILHGSRGAWIGLPIEFLMINIFYWRSNIKKILFLTIFPMILVVCTLTLIPNSPIQKRLDAFHSDREKIVEGNNYNSSIGARILLWKNALQVFQNAPISGVGIVELKQSNCDLYKQGKVGECLFHVHNVYLQALAAHGLFGLSAILFLLFAPLIFFIQHIKTRDNEIIYLLSVSGIAFISYIMICSLTDLYFMIRASTMLYYLVTITLISLILREKKHNQN